MKWLEQFIADEEAHQTALNRNDIFTRGVLLRLQHAFTQYQSEELSIETAAVELRISEETLRRRIRRGEVSATRRDRRLYVTRRALTTTPPKDMLLDHAVTLLRTPDRRTTRT